MLYLTPGPLHKKFGKPGYLGMLLLSWTEYKWLQANDPGKASYISILYSHRLLLFIFIIK